MIIRAGEAQHALIAPFLQREAVYNTFLISDIESHRYDKGYQQVYLSTDHRGACRGVYLRYFNNLILSGDATGEDADFLISLIDPSVNTIMGKASCVSPLEKQLSLPHTYIQKELFALRDQSLLVKDIPTCGAGLSDVDRIHAFLMSIPEFKQIYAVKDMIFNRIQNGEGIHLYLERGGEIIAHINSAAQTETTCMVGGLGVAPAYRGQGLGKGLVSALCREMLRQGRTPCLFNEAPPERSLFKQIGFNEIGKWGVVTLRHTL